MKITRSQFRKLILLNVLAFVVYIVLSEIGVQWLPNELQVYLETQEVGSLSTLGFATGIYYAALGLWSLQNLYALYKFKSYAPKHLLLLWIFAIPVYFVDLNPVIMTVWDVFAYDLAMMISSFTLALVFFSNIHEEFQKSEG